jgi:hypothetical protein
MIVLLHEQDGQALVLEAPHDVPDLPHDDGRQALRWLVEEEQAPGGQEGAADRQHLLLAARQCTAGLLGALTQARKDLQHALERPAAGAGSEEQILPHAERREDAAALRHEGDAAAGDAVGGPGMNGLAVEVDPPRAGRGEAHDATNHRRLPRAVAAQQGHRLARLHAERDAVQHVTLPVVGLDAVDAEQGGHAEPR